MLESVCCAVPSKRHELAQQIAPGLSQCSAKNNKTSSDVWSIWLISPRSLACEEPAPLISPRPITLKEASPHGTHT